MSHPTESTNTRPKRRRKRAARQPTRRNRRIYERHVIEGETQERVAAEFGITQQRVGQIVARVEAWLATHADDPLTQRMRLRTSQRWEAIWSRAIEGFDRSREDRETKKERVVRHTISGTGAPHSGETPLLQVTVSETTVSRQNGDPRYLRIATRVAEREDRMWPREPVADSVRNRAAGDDQNSHEFGQGTDHSRARQPKRRDRRIYERHVIEGETQERVAAALGITQQRVGQIAARVDAWIATHSDHPLAQRMRLKASRRWEAIWSRAIEGFDRSQEDRETKKERVVRGKGPFSPRGRPRASREPSRTNSGETPLPQNGEAGIPHSGETPLPQVTVSETSIRRQNGDPQFLATAVRVAERDDRMWPREPVADLVRSRAAAAGDDRNSPEFGYTAGQNSHEFCYGADEPRHARFPCLPAGLCDLEHLACGLRVGPESVAETCGDGTTPVPILFERRCAEAFRCLGFEVTEQGQGCGRVADSLAVAVLERFALIIDAKVRRDGYKLRTDDRQFCEYATRHSRELARSGIERVYFVVVGHGFRQEDLDKLAGVMTGTPIRSVCFIEVAALMRLVNDSIARRRDFRLDELDRLLFGNKIIVEAMVTHDTGARKEGSEHGKE